MTLQLNMHRLGFDQDYGQEDQSSMEDFKLALVIHGREQAQ